MLPDFHRAAAPPLPQPPSGSGVADWVELFRNRLILAGLGLIALLVVGALLLIAIGNGDDEPQRRASLVQPTPAPGSSTPGGDDLTGVLRTTASMRNGPGIGYPPIGTVPEGAAVPVVGRNADDSWVQVVFPPGSELLGWVNVAFIDVNGDISALVVAGPGESPNVPVPTSSGPLPGSETPADEPTSAPTRRPTNTRVPTITPRPGATPTIPSPFQQ